MKGRYREEEGREREMRKRERDRDFPKCHKSQGWGRPKVKVSSGSLRQMTRDQVFGPFCHFPKYISRELNIKWNC